MIDNKRKLLDAAERSLAEQGSGAISSRQIIADAEVNPAAIHYHFGLDEKAYPWTRTHLLTIGLDHERPAIRPRFRTPRCHIPAQRQYSSALSVRSNM
jgi:hypothetical protein